MLSNKTFYQHTFLESKNEELSQAVARLIFLSIFVSYFLVMKLIFNEEDVKSSVIAVSIFFMIYGLIHFRWVKRATQDKPLRKFVAVFVDVGAVTFAMYLLDWTGLILFSVYLWIIVGNGMRFGKVYLFAAMILTLVGFGSMLYFHSFWIENREIGFGLISIISILPLFFLVMLNRLQYTNKQLKEQLKIQKHQEVILLQQSRHAAMGEMISNIAHQWRQPLNAVGLIFQNMEYAYEMNTLDEKYLRKTIDKGMKLISSMSTTIDDFRNFFKPNKQKELFSIDAVIKSSLEIMEMNLKQKNIEVVLDFKDDTHFYGYKNEFSQVILNILANAKDILLEREIQNANILILSYKKDDRNIIEISDNGKGISEDIITHVFDPYFTTKEHIDGTGIGLYMSKLIVEEHMDGRLSVENSFKGAVFSVSLASTTLDTEEENV